MSANLKAIQTDYCGVRFRSRQEARWASIFNRLGIEWEYEAEGFQLPTHWYVPDFWFPLVGCFAEVKPFAVAWSDEAITKAAELALATKRAVIMCDRIDSMWPLITAFCPQAGIVDRYEVDLTITAAKKHVWVEVDGCCMTPMDHWNVVAEAALAMRFYDPRT